MLVVADQRARRDRRDSVVLPVPDRPKNTAASSGLPGAWLAEQCIGITPLPGSR
jgi:hypothetical protein